MSVGREQSDSSSPRPVPADKQRPAGGDVVRSAGPTNIRTKDDAMVTCSVVSAGSERLEGLKPLWQVLQAHHASVAPHFGPIRSPEESWARGRRGYEARLQSGEAFVLIAEEDGAAIGYAFVHLHAGSDTWATTDRVAELETLVVLPCARGRGVGGALMAAVMAELQRRNVCEWRVGVVATNHDAVRFYQRYRVTPSMVFFVGRVPDVQLIAPRARRARAAPRS